MLRLLLSRVRATLRRSRLDDELDDELREHLALLQERFVRNGMNPSETFYAARRHLAASRKSRRHSWSEAPTRACVPCLPIFVLVFNFFDELRRIAPATRHP